MSERKTMSQDFVLTTIYADGIATVTLNRLEVHNAFDNRLIAELTEALKSLDKNPKVRVLVLAGNGKSFSAGADLNWMQRMANYSAAENLKDARALAELMWTLNQLSKPTIARVHGAAYGGGVGLVACCDIAIASREATFALSEVRLGLIPAAISPYVVAAIGERMARRYMLTGERFDAAEAYRIGLIHDLVEAGVLDETVGAVSRHLLSGGPHAISAAKNLIASVARRPLDKALIEDSAARIAKIRASAEGREGVNAFLEKRNPGWIEAPKSHRKGREGRREKAKDKAKTIR